MKRNWLENKLYDRLKERPSEIDLDAAWKALENKRNPEKDDKGIAWPWILSGVLLLATLSFWGFSSINSSTSLLSHELNNTQLSTEASIQAMLRPDEPEVRQSIVNSKPGEGKPSLLAKQTTKKLKSNQKKRNFSNISSNTHNNIASNDVKHIINNAELVNQTTKAGEQFPNQIPIYSNVATEQEELGANTLIASRQTDESNALSIGLVPRIEINPLDVKRDIPELSFIPETNHVKNLSQSSRKRIGVDLAYGTMFSNLNHNNQFVDLSTHRNEIEKSLDHYALAINYEHFIGSRLYLKTGLSFSQFTSTFENIVASNETETREDTVAHIINPFGENEFVLGDKEVTLGIRSNHFLKYRSIQIPFGIGLDLPLNEKWSADLSAGVNYALLILNQGSYLEFPDSGDQLTDLASGTYRSTGVFSGFGTAGIYRHYNAWSFGLATSVQFDLNNRIDTGFQDHLLGLTHKLNALNLVISMKHNF